MADVAFIRKVATALRGRSALEELTAEHSSSLGDILSVAAEDKLASVEDLELFKVAESMPGDTHENYESFGGQYKVAFGTPMFQATAAPDPAQTMVPAGGAAPGAPKPAAAAAPPAPTMAGPAGGASGAPGGMAGAAGGMKAPGAGGGQTNPMQAASTPQTPGAGVKTGTARYHKATRSS